MEHTIDRRGRLVFLATLTIAFCYACAEDTQAPGQPFLPGGSGGGAGVGGTGGGSPPTMGGAGSAGGPASTAGSLNKGGAGAANAGAGGSAGGGAGMSGAGGAGGAGGGGGVGGAAGNAGSGGRAGAGGGGGSGGGGPTNSFRYVRFVATSEQAGAVWSAVAELSLFTTGDAAISRSGWTITADSEETDDESAPASAAIDGVDTTFWHSAWEPGGVGDAELPHELRIDLGAAHVITGFSYLPRQDQANGRIAGWAMYLSKDNVTWGTPVDSGTFSAGATLQKITF